MRLQGQVIELKRAENKVIDYGMEGPSRKEVLSALRRRDTQLGREVERKSKEVEELKTTLSVVLRKNNENMASSEEKLFCLIKQMIMHYVDVLESTTLNTKQRQCVSELKKSIEDSDLSLSPGFMRECAVLTPVEIRVAAMIKQGKSTKEIAGMLYLSTRTIESHRRNIRKKLGLNNKRVSLMTHLMTNAAPQ